MKLSSLLFWTRLVAAARSVTATSSTEGVEALLQRRLPQQASSFEFAITNTSEDFDSLHDSYSVSSTEDDKILVQGNTVSALLSGSLHAYLSEVVHVDIWWYIGSQLELAPQNLPVLSTPLQGSSTVKYRYHLNTVTTSYTSAFWSWEDWELHLDWMALRGINLPLAWIGFEKILTEVFLEIGFSSADVDDFISGPAFLAWNHFGNIQGSWGRSMPSSWVEDQFSLQLKIVRRMVELGMTPILPAFPGFVPPAISRVFPSANVSNSSVWESFPSRFTSDTFLDPFDPLFAQLQERVISKQKSYYGDVTQFWTLDQFNENDPASGDLNYLHSVSRNTWQSLKSADPDAVWVMQGWLFSSSASFWTNERIEAFLGGVSVDSDMLILDLFAESQPQWKRTNSFYGKPWIWCQLHDYGGNMGLYGQIMNVTIDAVAAVDQANSSLVGFGLSMEGLEGNEIMYDLLLSQAWKKAPIDTTTYFSDWVTSRYGASGIALPKSLYSAWEMVRSTVFNNTHLAANAVPKSIFELSPNISGLVNRTGHHPTLLNYDPDLLVSAWREMYEAGIEEPSLYLNAAYHYDLVDWTRQVLSNGFIPLYEKLITAYTSTNNASRGCILRRRGQKLTSLLTTLDKILSTNENFRLSTWIKSARATANASVPEHADIADFLEYEARNQVTLWGPSGQISDYASRSWSGLVSTYYLPRWQKFVEYLIQTPVIDYNQTSFRNAILPWELAWGNQTTGATELHDSLDDLKTVLQTAILQWPDIFTL